MRSMCKCVYVDERRSALTCGTGAQENKRGSRRTPEPQASLCLLQLLPESRGEQGVGQAWLDLELKNLSS